MSEISYGGPAFPIPGLQHDADFNGMTLRDYFAAKALPGLMGRDWSHMAGKDTEIIATWAKSAYAVADTMMKARETQD